MSYSLILVELLKWHLVDTKLENKSNYLQLKYLSLVIFYNVFEIMLTKSEFIWQKYSKKSDFVKCYNFKKCFVFQNIILNLHDPSEIIIICCNGTQVIFLSL